VRIDIEYSDLDRVIRNLDQAQATLDASMDDLCEQIGAEFVAKCEEESPRGDKWRERDPRRTGTPFAELWDYEVTPLSEDSTEIAIKNLHSAAGVILLGRETPWVINAKSPKGMSFPWEALPNWGWVYGAQQVTHPPMEGAMTHEKTLELLRDDIEMKLSQVAERVAYEIVRP